MYTTIIYHYIIHIYRSIPLADSRRIMHLARDEILYMIDEPPKFKEVRML